MNNNQGQEPNLQPLAQGCPPPTSIGQCTNLANQSLLPCKDPNVDNLGPVAAIIRYVNLLRGNMNRLPLQPDDALAFGAQFKADEMVENNYFGHIFQGRDAVGLATQLRPRLWTNCIAENIHQFYSTAYEIFAGWFCSASGNPNMPLHFENMTDPKYDRIGVGYAPANPMTGSTARWVMWLASSSNQNQFGCLQPFTPTWVFQSEKWYYHCNCLQPNQNGYWIGPLSDGNWYWLDSAGAWTGWKWNQVNGVHR